MARTKKQIASLILSLFTMVFSLVAIFSVFLPIAKAKNVEDNEIIELLEELMDSEEETDTSSLGSITTIDVAKIFIMGMTGNENIEDMTVEELGKVILTAILIQGDSTEGMMSFLLLGASILVVLLGFVTALLGLIGAFAKGKTGALVLSILTWIFSIASFIAIFMMMRGSIGDGDSVVKITEFFSMGMGPIVMLASTTAAFGTAIACVVTKDKKVKEVKEVKAN